jgi:hypothetical protein
MSYEDNNNIDSNYENKSLKKKNRTLQYYKFLFYSLKTEIKVHEFIKLIRASNAGEISLWVISLFLYISTPKDFPKLTTGQKSTSYKNSFIWFHFMHVIRGAIGIAIIYTFPRSFQVINSLESTVDSKLEKTLFNDLIRENIFFNVTEKIKSKKVLVIIYIILTIINFAFDMIDFLIVLASLSGAIPAAKVVLLTYLLIAILYVISDLGYIFWIDQLKYCFPKEYLNPTETLFMGIVNKALVKFKLRKPNTDIVSEAKAQQSNSPYVGRSNDINNGGVNILENILHDSFGIKRKNDSYNINEKNNIENIGNRKAYPDNQNNPPGSEDQFNQNNYDV